MTATLADRCECGYEDDLPPVEPWHVLVKAESTVAHYWCTRCGRSWWTSWLAEGPDEETTRDKTNRGGPRPVPMAARYWAKVNKSGPVPEQQPDLGQCWIWTGAKRKGGWAYGKFSISRSVWVGAHVVGWVIEHGPIPAGRWVLHRCDNPACVRPSHLFLGVPRDNTQDMLSKGRSGRPAARGERNSHARVTEADVIAIRTRFAAGELRAALATEYGLTDGYVGHIVNGRAWREVGGPIRTPGQIGRRRLRKEAA